MPVLDPGADASIKVLLANCATADAQYALTERKGSSRWLKSNGSVLCKTSQ